MISVADLKAWLGNPTGEGVTDLLTALEARAVEVVESETERYFGTSTTHQEVLEGDNTRALWLNEAPSSITTLEERRPGGTWDAIVEANADGFELYLPRSHSGTAKLVRKHPHVWRWGWEYRVTYDFGYTAGQEPGDIRQAVMDLVAIKFRERGREGLRSEKLGDYSFTVLSDAMGSRDIYGVPGLKETLLKWRRSTRSVA